MNKYIDKTALLQEAKKELRECQKDGEEFGGESILWAEGMEFVIDIIKQAPVCNAVRVVRCKECKYYREGEIMEGIKFCYRLRHPTEDRHIGYNFADDDFCSYGERKDER